MDKFVSHRARFSGTLGDIKTIELKGLDYSKPLLKDRLQEVVNKLDKVEPFMNEYFNIYEVQDEERPNVKKEKIYYNYSPNMGDELSEDINICQYIQSYANYILNSKDLPKEKKQEYSILSEEEFKKQLLREMSTDFKVESNVILDTRATNDYKNMNLKITNKDLNPHLQNNKYGVREKDLELSGVLNAYMDFKNYLKAELRKIQMKESSKHDLYKIRNLLSTVNDDMLLSKQKILALKSPAKRLGDESPSNDFSPLDYNNPEHIKQMLKFCKVTCTPRPDDMASHIGYDLHKAIGSLYMDKKLDKIDLEIIECYNANYTFEDMAKEVNRDTKTIQQRLDKICRRIANVI